MAFPLISNLYRAGGRSRVVGHLQRGRVRLGQRRRRRRLWRRRQEEQVLQGDGEGARRSAAAAARRAAQAAEGHGRGQL